MRESCHECGHEHECKAYICSLCDKSIDNDDSTVGGMTNDTLHHMRCYNLHWDMAVEWLDDNSHDFNIASYFCIAGKFAYVLECVDLQKLDSELVWNEQVYSSFGFKVKHALVTKNTLKEIIALPYPRGTRHHFVNTNQHPKQELAFHIAADEIIKQAEGK